MSFKPLNKQGSEMLRAAQPKKIEISNASCYWFVTMTTLFYGKKKYTELESTNESKMYEAILKLLCLIRHLQGEKDPPHPATHTG